VLAHCIAQSGIGKMAIHPAQIESINEIFMPSKDSIAKARAIAAAVEFACWRRDVAIQPVVLRLHTLSGF